VKHEKTNATIPKDRKPEEVTMAEAVKLLAEREALNPTKKAARGAKPKAKPSAKAKLDDGKVAQPKAAKAPKVKAAPKAAKKPALSAEEKAAAKLAKEIEKLKKENEKLRSLQKDRA
jgi:DNA topoisomerase-1